MNDFVTLVKNIAEIDGMMSSCFIVINLLQSSRRSLNHETIVLEIVNAVAHGHNRGTV